MAYLDSRQHYEYRQSAITWAALYRAYYNGHPYSDSAVDHYSQDIWRTLMRPDDATGKYPLYFDNIARIIIENTVNDILPSESMLRIKGAKGLDEKALEEFYACLFNFGATYQHNPTAFISWAKKCLIDVAQTGNGLIFLRLVPTDGKPYVDWQYYPMEGWSAEQIVLNNEPAFYRIEYKYTRIVADGTATDYWHRLDIYRDHLVRYHDTPAIVQQGQMDSAVTPWLLQSTADTFASTLPPDMSVMTMDDALEAAEQDLMSNLSDWICVPLIWERKDPTDMVGVTALRTNRLQAIDQSNRLLTGWGDAAVKHGDPELISIDLEIPDAEEEGQNPEGDTHLRADIMQASSTGAMQSRFMYPDNIPRELLHKSPMSAIRQSIFEGAPNLTIDAETMATFKDLSGFASGQLNKNHDSKVRQLRDDLVVGGILRALRIALELLDAANALPVGITPKSQLGIRVAGRSFSPDEEMKMATTFASMQDRRFPPEVLLSYASRWLDIEDEDEFTTAIEEYTRRNDEILEMARQAKDEKPSAAKEDAPENDKPGTDNRLK